MVETCSRTLHSHPYPYLSTSVSLYLPFSGILFVRRCLVINMSRMVVQLSYMVFWVLDLNLFALFSSWQIMSILPQFSPWAVVWSKPVVLHINLFGEAIAAVYFWWVNEDGRLSGGHEELVSSPAHGPPPSSLSSPPQSTSPPNGHQSCTGPLHDPWIECNCCPSRGHPGEFTVRTTLVV